MYRCTSCKTLFSEPLEVTEATGVTADVGAFGSISEIISYDACPECGSIDIERAPQCDICGGYEDIPEDATVCDGCREDMEGLVAIAFNNFKNLHQDATDDDMYDLLALIVEEYDDKRRRAWIEKMERKDK